MKKYINNAGIYDSTLTKSKIYRIGDRQLLEEIKNYCKKYPAGIQIFEPGCGTGLITEQLALIKNAHITAVDPSSLFISAAKKRLSAFDNVKLVRKSAVNFKLKHADLAVMRFVYHHIKDSEKYIFIKNSYSSLKKGGKIMILDEFIPFYTNKKGWKQSLTKFHDLRSRLALGMNDRITAACEQDAKMFGLKGKGEYKVHLKILELHLKNAGFSCIRIKLVKHPKLKNSRSLGIYLVTAWKV
jgi:ubiquinone/menaquinone biosynthesis C-methylase UbiE